MADGGVIVGRVVPCVHPGLSLGEVPGGDPIDLQQLLVAPTDHHQGGIASERSTGTSSRSSPTSLT